VSERKGGWPARGCALCKERPPSRVECERCHALLCPTELRSCYFDHQTTHGNALPDWLKRADLMGFDP
jgi:hypothetical protein